MAAALLWGSKLTQVVVAKLVEVGKAASAEVAGERVAAVAVSAAARIRETMHCAYNRWACRPSVLQSVGPCHVGKTRRNFWSKLV